MKQSALFKQKVGEIVSSLVKHKKDAKERGDMLRVRQIEKVIKYMQKETTRDVAHL